MNKRIQKFLENKCIWYNDNCYTFLNDREVKVIYIILKTLYEIYEKRKFHDEENKLIYKNRQIKQCDLFNLVSSAYNDFILQKSEEFGKSISNIKASEYSWIIGKDRKGVMVLRNLTMIGFHSLLFRIYPLFVNICEKGSEINRQKGTPNFYIIRINKVGRALFDRWNTNRPLEEEDE